MLASSPYRLDIILPKVLAYNVYSVSARLAFRLDVLQERLKCSANSCNTCVLAYLLPNFLTSCFSLTIEFTSRWEGCESAKYVATISNPRCVPVYLSQSRDTGASPDDLPEASGFEG